MLGIFLLYVLWGFVECRKGVRNTRMLLRFLRNRDLVNPRAAETPAQSTKRKAPRHLVVGRLAARIFQGPLIKE